MGISLRSYSRCALNLFLVHIRQTSTGGLDCFVTAGDSVATNVVQSLYEGIVFVT